MRAIAIGLICAGGLLATACALPRPLAPGPKADPEAGRYVTLTDGRRIGLSCTGKGSPTVVLTAGMGDWSGTWAQIQPALAASTRTCAWDRAGVGFSSPSRVPQTIEATTADLEAALARASVKGPLVVVGHSFGGLETLRFADRHRRQVAGMVLVDATVPDQYGRWGRVAPAYMALVRESLAGDVERLRGCAAALYKRGEVTAADAPPCIPYGPAVPPAVRETLLRLDRDPARIQTRASLIENFEGSMGLAVNAGRTFGDMPLIVLTSGRLSEIGPDEPEAVRAGYPIVRGEQRRAHGEIAALSTRGEQRIAAGSGHYIQNDEPDVVIRAIEDVVSMARARGGGR